MTKEQAIAKAETGWWEGVDAREIVAFQLFEERMCMPFDRFHQAVEETLGRPVWTHEFAWPENLRAEFNGQQAPSMQEIVDLIPAEKRIIVSMEEDDAADEWKNA